MPSSLATVLKAKTAGQATLTANIRHGIYLIMTVILHIQATIPAG